MARNLVRASYTRLEVANALVAEPLTLAGWAKTNGWTGYQCVLSVSGDTGNYRNIFCTSGGNVRARSTPGGYSEGGVAPEGTWFHIAGVFATVASRTAYLNGSAASENTDSWDPDRASTIIGARWDLTDGFDGALAELAAWNAALSGAEIASLAAGWCPLWIRPQDLVGYWPEGGLYGRHDNCLVNNALNMTAYNSPTWTDHPPILYPRPKRTIWTPAAGGPSVKPAWYYQRNAMRRAC
jgi:hypothetical protein